MTKRKDLSQLLLMFLCMFCLMGIHYLRGENPKKIESTSPEMRIRGYKKHVSLQKSSNFNHLRWRFIGPDVISGRCTDVDVPRGNKHTIYVGTATGGVWKTTNSGTTWELITENIPSSSIGDIAVDQNNPQIIWVGTGEANILRTSVAGTGIYKSRDAGKTWEHMGLSDSHTIARIVIHPDYSDIVYAAVSGHEWTPNQERGVFKTTDGGLNWEKMLYIDDTTGAIDLVMDPDAPDTLYASMWKRTRKRWSDPVPEPGDGLFKTTDGGKTWKPLTQGLPDPKFTRRIGLDIARNKSNILYAFVDNHQPGRKPKPGERDAYGHLKTEPKIKGMEVYRSDDKGENWIKVSPEGTHTEEICSTYGWVFGQIRVDPTDENTVYIMGVWMEKSTDGGRIWKNVGLEDLHCDHHGLWIDPEDPNYLINVNDGGVYVSYDSGLKWQNFYHNLPAVQFYNVAVDMEKPFNVYGSVQDHFTYRGNVTHRPNAEYMVLKKAISWERAPGGEGTSIVVDPEDPHTMYSSYPFYGHLMRSELLNGGWESKNILPASGEDEPPLRGQWMAPTILSPHNPKIIYHGMQYVFRSMDRGETWERISPDLTYNDPETTGKIPYMMHFHCLTEISESPLKFGLIYAGTDDGRVHVTKNGGFTWTEITEGLPYYKHVSRITASRYDEATVYLTMEGRRDDDMNDYLFKSTDYGETWVDISGNIPCGPVNVIREDPKKQNILYAGTDFGVYVSLDDGRAWKVLGDRISLPLVWDLVIHPRDNTLVAATYGSGIWVIDEMSLIQNYNPLSTKNIEGKNIDLTKQIEGEYEIEVWGEAVKFYFLNEELFVEIEGDTEGTICNAVKGKPLQYEAVHTGLSYDIEFVKDNKGRIIKCILKTMGAELEAVKIIH